MTQTRFRLQIALASLLCGGFTTAASAAPSFSTSPAEIAALSADGQHQLALVLLDNGQPTRDATNAMEWQRWEALRWDVLRDAGAWSALLARLQTLPAGLPPALQRHAATHRAEALLMTGRAREAQQTLFGVIWGPLADAEMLPIWRGMLIRSYLAQAAYTDAAIATERYRQDYGVAGGGLGAHGLARVQILAGQPEQALASLSGHSEQEAQALRWLLEGRRGALDAGVLTQIREGLAKPGLSPELVGLYWQIVRESAERRGDHATRVEALEQLLLAGPVPVVNAGLYTVGPDDLWQGYRALAEQITNASELLVGDQAGWMALALTRRANEPRQARAVYAALSQLAEEPMQREQADSELMSMLATDERFGALLPVLYRQSSRFPVLAELPLLVQQVLINQALTQRDFTSTSQMLQLAAAELFAEDVFAWQLLSARVHALAGNSSLAAAPLAQLASRYDSLSAEQQAGLVGVLDELAATRSAGLVLTIWQQMQGKLTEVERLPRIAALLAREGRYQDAARHFLQAAQLPVPDAQRWDYRRQAADALASGGLDQDARTLYQRLQGQTTDPARLTLLRERLHGLR